MLLETVGDYKFANVTIPSLVEELHHLQKELKKINEGLIKHLETRAVVVIDDSDLASLINDYSDNGWSFKEYIPSRQNAISGMIDRAVVVFERESKGE